MLASTRPFFRLTGAAFAHQGSSASSSSSASGGAGPAHKKAATAAPSSTTMPQTPRQCFGVLGLPPACPVTLYTEQDIKRAYRNRVRVCHPDVTGGSDTEFRCVKFAFDVLIVNPNTTDDTPLHSSKGSGGAGSTAARGFYDHPHTGSHDRERHQRYYGARMHTSRTPRENESRRDAHHTDPTAEWLKQTATEFQTAVREGRAVEYLRAQRAARDARQHAKYGGDEERRRHYEYEGRLLWLGILLKASIISTGFYFAIAVALPAVLSPLERHSHSRYEEAYVASLQQVTVPGTAQHADRLRSQQSLEETVRAAEKQWAAEQNKAAWDKMMDQQQQAHLATMPKVATYKGQPHTMEGLAKVRELRRLEREAKKKKAKKDEEPLAQHQPQEEEVTKGALSRTEETTSASASAAAAAFVEPPSAGGQPGPNRRAKEGSPVDARGHTAAEQHHTASGQGAHGALPVVGVVAHGDDPASVIVGDVAPNQQPVVVVSAMQDPLVAAYIAQPVGNAVLYIDADAEDES